MRVTSILGIVVGIPGIEARWQSAMAVRVKDVKR